MLLQSAHRRIMGPMRYRAKRLTATVLLLAASGCGKSSPPPPPQANAPVTVKVAYWGGPEEMAILQGVIERWQRQHPQIQVRLEHTPFSVYVSRLLTRMAGNVAPDIMATEVNMFVNFWAKGALLPLNRFIDHDASFHLKEFFPEVVQRFSVDGYVYAIPRDTAPFACIFYNKRLFDEAGLSYPSDDWTLEDLLQAAQRLTKRDTEGHVEQYGFYAWAWQNFVYSYGGWLVNDLHNPTRCLLGDPKAVQGLQFYADLMNKYQVAPTPVALGNLAMGAQQLFMSQRVAMFSSGIWETPILRQITDFDWDVAMFPKGPSGTRAFGTGGTGYCILQSSKHPEAAWEVLKALAGDEAQTQLGEQGLAQPANQRIAQGPAWAEHPLPPKNKRMLNDAVRYVVYEPFILEWREIYELHVLPELDLVFNGQQPAVDAVARIVPKVNAALAQRKPTAVAQYAPSSGAGKASKAASR